MPLTAAGRALIKQDALKPARSSFSTASSPLPASQKKREFRQTLQVMLHQGPVIRLGIDNQDPHLGISGCLHTISLSGNRSHRIHVFNTRNI